MFKNVIKPPIESDREKATIKVPVEVHEDIHREAASRGLSVEQFIKMILEFFIGSENSHLLQSELNTEEYKNQQRIWQEDLVKIAQERDNFLITS